MKDSSEPPYETSDVLPGGLRLVSSRAAAPRPPLRDKLLRDWKLIKGARFNAAKRFERKQSASLMTLAVIAFYTGSLYVFNLTFKESLTEHARAVLDFVAQFFGLFTLIVGLVEQLKDYPGRARELHDCARRVNLLQKQLEATPIDRVEQLQPFLAAYDAAIRECRVNHDDVDYELAEATRAGPEPEHESRLRRARLFFHVETYWLYTLLWVAPFLVTAALLAWTPALPVK